MNSSQLFTLSGFVAPIISGTICMVVMIIFFTNIKDKTAHKLALLVISELLVCVLSWGGMIVYVTNPMLFFYIESIFAICILYAQVITYHLLFVLTRQGSVEKFKTIHYIIPIVYALILLILSFSFPTTIKLQVIETFGKTVQGYEQYMPLLTSIRYVFPVFSIFYGILGLRRIKAFKNTVSDYSADEGKTSVGWLRLLIFTTLATIPLAASPVLVGIDRFVASAIIVLFPTLLIVLKDVVLTYNIVAQNYIIVNDMDNMESDNEIAEPKNRLNKGLFENFMTKHKPYLNPKLRITDLAQELATNRTYLSNFINQEYGMNFSRLINSYRLNELQSYRVNPKYSAMSGMELVQEVGFSSFRAYLRAKDIEDKKNTLLD